MEIIWNNLGSFLQGASITIRISAVAICLGLVLGSIFGLMRISGSVILRLIAGVYIEVIRGTPLLVQLLYIYFGLPQIGIILPPFTAAAIASPSTVAPTWPKLSGRGSIH